MQSKLVVHLRNWGQSQGLVIPKNIMQMLGWEKNQALNLEITPDQQIMLTHIKKARSKRK